MATKQVSWRERISYGLGYSGFSSISVFLSTYLMFFYTDIFGISTVAVASLFLFTKIIDPFIDPLVGTMIDRTNSRWGKARPYIIWFGLPFAVIAVLMFTTVPFNAAGKLIYVYITYILYNILYSFIITPMSSIIVSITSNNHERTVVNTIGATMSIISMLIVSTASMPLIGFLGNGNQPKGFFFTMLFFASLSVILFLTCFMNVRERVVQINENKRVSFKELSKVIKNAPWLIISFMIVILAIGNTIRSQSMLYYLKYYIGKSELMTSFLFISYSATLFAMFLSPWMSKYIRKKNLCVLGFIGCITGSLLIFAAGTSNIPLLQLGNIVYSIGAGLPASILGAMFADTVDYGEWKNGVNSRGLLYSSISLCNKLGVGIGGALGASILAIGNYSVNKVQSSAALAAIKFNFVWAYVIAGSIIILLLSFYTLDKQHAKISAELAQRREMLAK